MPTIFNPVRSAIAVSPAPQSVFERGMASGLTRGWIPVRVKKTRQIKIMEPASGSPKAEGSMRLDKSGSGFIIP
jgi:hypothetical protein